MCTNNYTLPLLCGLLDGIEVFACVKGYTYDSNAVTCEGRTSGVERFFYLGLVGY